MSTEFDIKKAACEIEKISSTYIRNEVHALMQHGGEKLGYELAFTVATMILARAVAQIHVETGERLASVLARADEATEGHVDILVKKYAELLKTKEGKK